MKPHVPTPPQRPSVAHHCLKSSDCTLRGTRFTDIKWGETPPSPEYSLHACPVLGPSHATETPRR